MWQQQNFKYYKLVPCCKKGEGQRECFPRMKPKNVLHSPHGDTKQCANVYDEDECVFIFTYQKPINIKN